MKQEGGGDSVAGRVFQVYAFNTTVFGQDIKKAGPARWCCGKSAWCTSLMTNSLSRTPVKMEVTTDPTNCPVTSTQASQHNNNE